MVRNTSAWRHAPTIAFAIFVVSLLVAVWLISENIHTDRPVTLHGVSEEVTVGVDEFQQTLPPSAIVSVTDGTQVSACPGGRGGEQVALSRTITIAPEFDRLGWMNAVSAEYEENGWHASFRTLGSADHIELILVGLPLLIYRITSTDGAGEPQVLITSESRCSEPPTDR